MFGCDRLEQIVNSFSIVFRYSGSSLSPTPNSFTAKMSPVSRIIAMYTAPKEPELIRLPFAQVTPRPPVLRQMSASAARPPSLPSRGGVLENASFFLVPPNVLSDSAGLVVAAVEQVSATNMVQSAPSGVVPGEVSLSELVSSKGNGEVSTKSWLQCTPTRASMWAGAAAGGRSNQPRLAPMVVSLTAPPSVAPMPAPHGRELWRCRVTTGNEAGLEGGDPAIPTNSVVLSHFSACRCRGASPARPHREPSNVGRLISSGIGDKHDAENDSSLRSSLLDFCTKSDFDRHTATSLSSMSVRGDFACRRDRVPEVARSDFVVRTAMESAPPPSRSSRVCGKRPLGVGRAGVTSNSIPNSLRSRAAVRARRPVSALRSDLVCPTSLQSRQASSESAVRVGPKTRESLWRGAEAPCGFVLGALEVLLPRARGRSDLDLHMKNSDLQDSSLVSEWMRLIASSRSVSDGEDSVSLESRLAGAPRRSDKSLPRAAATSSRTRSVCERDL
mmetsp:Transcript_65489/g.189798  ORF Transcript_65489/g.189798 Transcript_65489/m.189798 type:complete len:502 (+) Transcript_65489:1039-2544(+)